MKDAEVVCIGRKTLVCADGVAGGFELGFQVFVLHELREKAFVDEDLAHAVPSAFVVV